MKGCQSVYRNVSGFTLIELIVVITVLSISAAVGSGFMVSVVDGYQKAKIRSGIVQRGTVVMEQMTRTLRMAMPNSVRVSSSGNCVEFMPLLGGAFYTSLVPDVENGMAAATSVPTIEFSLQGEVPKHVLVSPLSNAEVYDAGTTGARATAGSWGVEPYNAVLFTGAHRFERNSENRRLLVGADPQRFCVASSQVLRWQDYGLISSSLTDTAPAGTSVLMVSGVSAVGAAFSVSTGSEDRNTALDISLSFFDSGESATLSSRVLIRNVP